MQGIEVDLTLSSFRGSSSIRGLRGVLIVLLSLRGLEDRRRRRRGVVLVKEAILLLISIYLIIRALNLRFRGLIRLLKG